jgi:hypothetical protein
MLLLPASLQLRVLLVGALRLIDRVSLRVQPELREERIRQIDIIALSKAQDEVENIRQFSGNFGALLGVAYEGLRLFFRLESEMFKELRGFRDDSDGQILCVVIPIPIALFTE